MNRVLIYSHDTYGLGHLRRSMRIAAGIVETGAASNVLIASGSPQATSYPMPSGVDVVKLPAATKDEQGRYRSRTLGVGLDDLAMIRSRLVEAAIESFRPDVMLVDHAPTGMHDELAPVLDRLRMMPAGVRPSVVLGMREIIDSAPVVERQWADGGVWDRLSADYDGVIVYGDAVVKTTAAELRISDRISIPVVHVGYVCPDPFEHHVRTMPSIVVTAGGGGDGTGVLESYISFLQDSRLAGRVRSILVTGPFAPSGSVGAMVGRLSKSEPVVEVVQFSSQLETLLATAGGAISMAGYNTVAELLAHRVPALLVPRVKPRLEQWLRATRLASVASFTPLAAEDVTFDVIEQFVETVVSGHVGRDHQLDLGGARATGMALERLARSKVGAA
ncbi:MAG: hypothetical protein OEX04_13670 [Acidimicrobiia bacterium]|nr:hypothetical protein [Acidimicrobiia bacterium]MDH4308518.1 hypothetical protein [Acidimicrobiia bacterium]MDH5292212.1 hypothetical protein [Acidimicrobiia bacterium]